ncbi:hypothetical protein [Flavobacterium sp.]|uniref:hypothetical protein n=1 Tax=Flavobacterium sp. TaxID=239 RepID=UPI0037517ED8
MEEQNKNDWNALHTIVHIAKYIICIIIFLYSLTGFYEGNIYTAMVLLFTGIIFLPFVSKIWKHKLSFLDYYLYRRILFILLLMLAGYLDNLYLSNSI